MDKLFGTSKDAVRTLVVRNVCLCLMNQLTVAEFVEELAYLEERRDRLRLAAAASLPVCEPEPEPAPPPSPLIEESREASVPRFARLRGIGSGLFIKKEIIRRRHIRRKRNNVQQSR